MERQHGLFAYHQEKKQQISSMTQHWKEQWHKRQETHLRRKQISHRHKVISPPSRENAAKTKSNSQKALTLSPPQPLHLLSISSENSQKFLPRKQGDEYGAPKAPIISTYNKSAATSDQDHSLRSRPAQGKACTRCDADQSLGGDKGLTLQKPATTGDLLVSWEGQLVPRDGSSDSRVGGI